MTGHTVRGLFHKRAFIVTRYCSAASTLSEPTPLAMWRKALLPFVCCLAFREALSDTNESRATSVIKGEASISRLYRNVPVGVYASSSPYTAYTFHVPTVITAPKNMRVIPVNEESVNHNTYNTNGFFKDSYGNRFVNSPQTLGIKANFPQQYLQIQKLPAHLSQPLVSPPTYQFKQATPHFFAHTQFRGSSPFSRYAVSQPVVQDANIRTFSASPVLQPNFISHNNFNLHPVAQQQSTSYKPIFSNTQAHEQYDKFKNEPKLQRLQENLREKVNIQNVHIDHGNKNYNHPQPFHFEKEVSPVAPARETKITTYTRDGDKAIVNLETKPLHLLDISLLEPLTFDNPLVPQVQHFLPRINEATYHKLPEYSTYVNSEKRHKSEEEKPKTNNDGSAKRIPKTKNKSTKTKHNGPSKQNENDKNRLPTPSIKIKGTRYVSPEYSYEINSPNYKETYKEQIVRYNKETNSDPVHYNYNKDAQSEPIHYSYKTETQSEPIHYTYEKQVQKKPVQYYSNVHNSKQPQQEKKIYYENEEHCPKQVYTFKTDNSNDEQNNYGSSHENGESSSEDTSENEGSVQRPSLKTHDIGHEQYADDPHSSRHLVPEHREAEENHKIIQNGAKTINHDFPKFFAHIINDQANRDYFKPTHKSNEHIRVDPNQHIQRLYPARNQNAQKNIYSPNQHNHEKSKRVIIRDETPDGIHSHDEKQYTETVDQEENNEENFEKAYKNAAFGFPAYESNSDDLEKDIYNPETYGVPRDSSNFEHAPFQQYYEEGDKFPKYTHSNYKDARDKTKEDYYLDYSINKPESMIDRYNNRVGYYKMYGNHRPGKYFGFDQDEDKESEKQIAKYSIAPTFLFNHAPEQKQKQEFAKIQTSPYIYEYDYTKEAPRDNTAYGSQPHQRSKTKTQFVEPQFQYGFEPSSLPILLDSELATMASNVSPENEKPETRKKVYKENWYIKKTSTSGGSPAS
ncbi:unnamed protein product [Parnassius apollo]|uniref:(apollo) hypothetical protein n=1 Tax=Parnassius apollo TaxID=110799 RepID=A0A8S3WAQ1_PARAO|nr:unnamed protein product [Parnassius apollo]